MGAMNGDPWRYSRHSLRATRNATMPTAASTRGVP